MFRVWRSKGHLQFGFDKSVSSCSSEAACAAGRTEFVKICEPVEAAVHGFIARLGLF